MESLLKKLTNKHIRLYNLFIVRGGFTQRTITQRAHGRKNVKKHWVARYNQSFERKGRQRSLLRIVTSCMLKGRNNKPQGQSTGFIPGVMAAMSKNGDRICLTTAPEALPTNSNYNSSQRNFVRYPQMDSVVYFTTFALPLSHLPFYRSNHRLRESTFCRHQRRHHR